MDFIHIINRISKADNVRINEDAYILNFNISIVIKEDISIEDEIKYWLIALILISFLLIAVGIPVSIYLCKRRLNNKTHVQT